ncbi:DUF6056 family protein [Hymenobacter sp. 15J16-1T3B]|uniref:DUF6056 family protein n=1 Tax=Hymenobacter sp. 15J16-1T3B TaxID=2886941 RepID=UPI001D1005F6|nr:DUF6056 family protein [Hymenobacter sp. 15J16-1T3B]MCC3156359.1 DUF6056 family protein [Hymenobacter sp. 15J16-1T3B]
MPIGFSSRAARLALLALLLLGLLPFAALCAYNEPYSDDFINAWRTLAHGPMSVQRELYQQWTGRFFSTFLITALNPLTWGWLRGVRWAAAGIELALAAGLYAAIRQVWPGRLRRGSAAVASLTALLLYVQLLPDVYSAFYWFTAAAVYTLGLVCFTLVLVASAAGLRQPQGRRRGWAVVAGVAAVATAGTNEVQLLLLLATLAALLWVSWLRGAPATRRWWLMLLGVTLVAGAVAVAAPGNFVRLVDKGSGLEPLPHKLLMALPRTGRGLLTLLIQPRLLAALVLVYWWLQPLARRWGNPFGQRVPLRQSLPCLVAGLGLAQLVSYVGLGGSLDRLANVLIYALLLGWGAALLAAAPVHPPLPAPPTPRWRRALPWAGLLVLCATGPTARAWQEWCYSAGPYSRQMAQRYALIEAARRAGTRRLVVPPIMHVRPYHVLLSGQDLAAWPGYYANAETAVYFGLSELVVDEPLLPQAHHDFGGSWRAPAER